MENKKNDDDNINEIKIILLGESGVGKTNLINVFFGFGFDQKSQANNSSFSYEGEYLYKKKSYKYTIWDTAGQEQYRAINKIFLRGAKIILIVYAIDSRQTFEEIDFWINFVKKNQGKSKYIMALVANKIDLIENQMVMDEEGKEIAKKYGIKFLITSALSSAKSFINFVNNLVKDYIDKYSVEGILVEDTPTIKINKKRKKNKKKCC